MLYHMKFPQITTNRLILNQANDDDIETIVKVLNHEIYSINTINIPFPYSIQDAQFWLELSRKGFENENQYVFAIRLQENNQLIGGIDLGIDKRFNKAELGYWIDQDYSGKGYATESAKAVINFGFQHLKLKRIFATHFDFNKASGKVMENAGMIKEALLQCHTRKRNVYQNHFLYAIINQDL